jgi:hypothetical protein
LLEKIRKKNLIFYNGHKFFIITKNNTNVIKEKSFEIESLAEKKFLILEINTTNNALFFLLIEFKIRLLFQGQVRY